MADLETTAREFCAIRRVRKLRRAEGLLRLRLMYGPGKLSLRSMAAVAAEGGIVSLSDKGVLGRLPGWRLVRASAQSPARAEPWA